MRVAVRFWRALPAWSLLLVLSSLAAPTPAGPARDEANESPAEALAKIDRLIGAARCSSDQQCRVAGVGLRPCGGPESYRAWSTRDTRGKALRQVLQQHAELRRRQHEAEGLQSTCQVLPEPAARCERSAAAIGHCVLQGAQDAIR